MARESPPPRAAPPRVDGDQKPGCTGTGGGHRLEHGDADDRLVGAQRQPMRGRQRDADAGERARACRHGEPVDIAEFKPGLVQQLDQHRDQQLGMAALGHDAPGGENIAIGQDRGGALRAGAIESEDAHEAVFSEVPPQAAAARTSRTSGM